MDTVMRYYLSIDPETLPDEKWAWTYAYLREIRNMEKKASNG